MHNLLIHCPIDHALILSMTVCQNLYSQSNAVVQRLAYTLALEYVKNAPDGRDRRTEVVLVQYKQEPAEFKALFPW